ncbi:endothelin-converting enzyme homolog [Dermacentor albipictus]|uniref:endothelin-converting enzyme homolog n=1 Tax=Dermacentor albipictus TaxID=60249 RepID=UPI0038FC8636
MDLPSRRSPNSVEPAGHVRAIIHRSSSSTSSVSPVVEDERRTTAMVSEAPVQDATALGAEVSDRGQHPSSDGQKSSFQHLSRDRSANGTRTPTDVSRLSAINWDSDHARRHRRSATRGASWYTGSRNTDARTEDSASAAATQLHPAAAWLPTGMDRCIPGSRSSSESRSSTGKPGQRGVPSRGSFLPAATAPPDGALRAAVAVPSESHFLPAATPPREPRPLLPMLVVGACLLFLVMAVIVFVVLLPGRPGPIPKLCSTFECVMYGKQLSSSIDASVPPCHNFTRFVCGGWQREHQLSVREELNERVIEHMTRLVRTMAVPAADQNSVQRAAAVYRSCDKVLQGERDELATVKRALLEAGITWPRYNIDRDVVHTLLYSSLRLGWHVILRVDPRWSEEGVATLLVDPGEAYHFVVRRARVLNADFEQYFNILRDIFLCSDNNVTTFEDVMHFEDSFHDKLTAAYYERTEYRDFPDRTFLGLGDTRWMDVLTKLNVTVDKHFQVLTTGHRFVYSFFDLWDNHGETVAYGYTSWCTVQVAALYANRDLVLNYYGGSARRAQAYHGAFCVTAAYTFSRYAVFGSYSAEMLRGSMRTMAEAMTRTVGDSFLRRLARWRLFSRNIQVVGNWSSSSLSRAFRSFEAVHDPALAPAGLDMNDSFVQNWRKSTLVSRGADDSVLLAAVNSLELFAVYLFGARKEFQLLPVALSFPLFDIALTAPVVYAGFGASVAWALGLLFLAAYSSDPSTNTTVAQLKECVAGKPRGAELDADTVTAVALAAEAVLDALEQGVQATTDLPIPQLEHFTPTQLFFVALCFVHCEGGYARGNRADICDLSFRNVRRFASAFDCAAESPMNPTQRCGVP